MSKKRIKEKFTLKVEDIEKMLKKYIITKYPNVKYKLIKSNTTKSIYLTIYLEDEKRTMRISDHKSNKSKLLDKYMTKGNIINTQTLVSQIINIVERIKAHKVYKKLREISEK